MNDLSAAVLTGSFTAAIAGRARTPMTAQVARTRPSRRLALIGSPLDEARVRADRRRMLESPPYPAGAGAGSGGHEFQLPPRPLAAHRLGAALQPVGLEVVVVGTGRVAGLAGEHLPARAVGGAGGGDHAPARRPDGFVGVVGGVGGLAHRLLGAAGAEAAGEQAPQ